MAETRTIGIIAGRGAYPPTFIRAAREQAPDARLAMVALRDETDPTLEREVDVCEWARVGQMAKPIRFLRREGAREVVMVGQVAPKNLFALRPDLRLLKMLGRVRERNAETLFGAIADELAADELEILPATTFLEHLLPAAGPIAGPALKSRQLDDAAFGFRIAKETSRLDIGQSVVVRHGTVLAVEAFEGTNECLRRGAQLGRRREVMLVKVSKPQQDFRFDVPVVGAATIRTCHEAGVGAVVVEAARTLVLEGDEVRRLCEKHRVSLHAWE